MKYCEYGPSFTIGQCYSFWVFQFKNFPEFSLSSLFVYWFSSFTLGQQASLPVLLLASFKFSGTPVCQLFPVLSDCPVCQLAAFTVAHKFWLSSFPLTSLEFCHFTQYARFPASDSLLFLALKIPREVGPKCWSVTVIIINQNLLVLLD
jgi:hypothetical protein